MVNGVVGESVTLQLELPAGQKIDSITWLHNEESITFIQPSGILCLQFVVTAPERKKQLNITSSCSLQLRNLTMNDTGSYRAQVVSGLSKTTYPYILNIFAETMEDREYTSVSPGSTVYAQVNHSNNH
ncbi:SLAM family member 6 [Rhynchocyon petersi]